MTDQQNRDAQNSDFDIFKPSASSSSSDTEVEDKQINTESRKGFQAKGWHFGVITAIAAATWIFLPGSSAPAKNTHVLEPALAMRNDPAKGVGLDQKDTSLQPKEVSSEQPVPGPMDGGPKPSVSSVESGEKHDEMAGRIAILEEQLQKSNHELNETQLLVEHLKQSSHDKPEIANCLKSNTHKEVVKVSKPKAAVHKTVASKPKHEVQVGQVAHKATSSSQFSLNTVYRDQAWIQNAERTYVVQPGDVVEGLKIVSIDPLSRKVVTNHGVIR
ncbi:hypothetical protein ACFQDN_21510 [Pseudomonas asuensis]|uniref:Conjugal transfer protein TraP n=1 Tax=Pseudomonas asuensis TaxID=1825787 RepID=A0ABQ2H3N3_9PSED|nr:hypothetical protein [Pseudomonas asuensis]GGM26079.1 hypothetical protein GCM10009425_41020 [Pseudomonas asuensis]